jgi:ribosomal protein S18 acetylase RimI-like enzyme
MIGLASAMLTTMPVDNDAAVAAWRHVHNAIIPADPLSEAEVRTRRLGNHLTVTYSDNVLIGCATVRPPAGDDTTATVIVRVLPEYRRNGYGRQMFEHALAHARALGGDPIETIVWAANEDGLRFAWANGFVEVDRYLPDGADVPYLTLRMP